MATEQSAAPTAAPNAATASRVPHRWRNLLTLTGVISVDNKENNATTTLFPSISSALGLTSGNLGTLAALGRVASVPAGRPSSDPAELGMASTAW